ncbi:MAG: MHS family MFS transporter [Actinomycetota bacterium]|nr:MHS family MFS transporter [Actinomycetota bacterium]
MATSHEGSVTAAQPRTSILKVAGASLVGTTVEWYDFFLYGSAAALVFNRLFFPSFDPLVGTLLAFATYAVGFVARPLGGIVFGHYGDKIGRKSMLVITLMLMGVATFLIGLLPTYGTIGVWAPILLIVLRLVQGFALGGEWGGAVLMVAEHGGPEKRGFWASIPQAGVPLGNLLAVAVLAALSAVQTDEQFLSWGWRIPFLLSAVLVLIGLYIRLAVEESPVFKAAREQAAAAAATAEVAPKLPVVQVFRDYKREILVAMGARFVENASYYVFTAFILTYVTQQLQLPRGQALNAVLLASIVHFFWIPIAGALSDRLGRRPLYLIGAAGVGIWGFVFFNLLETRSFTVMVFAVTVALIFHGTMYGPQASFFSELFGTGVRYSGASIGYQLASIFAGSLSPIIAVALLARYRTWVPIAIYLVGGAIITIIAVLVAKETAHTDLTAVGRDREPSPATR